MTPNGNWLLRTQYEDGPPRRRDARKGIEVPIGPGQKFEQQFEDVVTAATPGQLRSVIAAHGLRPTIWDGAGRSSEWAPTITLAGIPLAIPETHSQSETTIVDASGTTRDFHASSGIGIRLGSDKGENLSTSEV